MLQHTETRTPASLNASLRSLLASSLDYLGTRWRLLKSEAVEAAHHSLHGLAFALLALLAAITGYLTGIIALTLWIARHWWHGDMLPAALIVMVVNLLLATAAILLMRRSLRGRSYFPHTLQELQNDRTWLQTPPTPSAS